MIVCLKGPLWVGSGSLIVIGYIRIKGEKSPARFPETDLKQTFPRTGSWRERPKSLIVLVGRTGVAH